MNTPVAVSSSPAKRRWWPRFRLLSLLLTVSALGIVFAYFGNLLHRVRHQRQVVAKIEAAGGKVRYNYQDRAAKELDAQEEDSIDFVSTSTDETPDGRARTIRRDIDGKIIDEWIATPPGPWIIRWALGDDLYAYVGSVSFANFDSKPIKEIDPKLLLELPELKGVLLTGRQVNDDWLASVAAIPQLRVAVLLGDNESTATGAGIARLQRADQLWSLGLSGPWVKDETAAGLPTLTGLRGLSLNDVPDVTSDVFSNLVQLPDLRELYIRRAKRIDDQGTEQLGRLKKMRSLSLIDTSVTDATLAHLASLDELEWLDLSANDVGDAGIEHVAALSKLKLLILRGTKVSGDGLEPLTRLPHLRYLSLEATNVTDDGMPAIGRMTELREVGLPRNITDDGLMHLRTLTKLRLVHSGPPVTKAGAEALMKELPECKVEW